MRYQCEICGMSYKTEPEALECENKPIEDPIVKVGDKVFLLASGEYEVIIVGNSGHKVEYILENSKDGWRECIVGNQNLINACKRIEGVYEPSSREIIENFIKAHGYTYRVEDVLKKYVKDYGRVYMSYSMENCCDNLKEEIEDVLKLEGGIKL